MTKNTSAVTRWTFEGLEFTDVDPVELGRGHIVAKTVQGGTYCSALPISAPEYRAVNHTPAAIHTNKNRVLIIDDWGKRYIIRIVDAPALWLDTVDREADRLDLLV